ncbi:MAG: hypothetical protein VKL59_07825 [Nostocaceae cyanobacterium]|nr:hypothetical protein [Nostocaceae cyanobacterium]
MPRFTWEFWFLLAKNSYYHTIPNPDIHIGSILSLWRQYATYCVQKQRSLGNQNQVEADRYPVVKPFHLYHDTNGACRGKAMPYPYVDFDVSRIW